jgi:prepilin-type N-terminal cleavage/methylation domain-containing protein
MIRGSLRRSGFTLIELMAVVAILGVLAAIAIPSLTGYMRKARASEAVQNLNTLYASAAALYVWERAQRGVSATTVTGCVAEPTGLTPGLPKVSKQPFVPVGGFLQLGFRLADYVYFGYGISSIGLTGRVTCFSSGVANTPNVYTFSANGDLDGDGTLSTFELAVGADGSNQLYHARGMYIFREIE